MEKVALFFVILFISTVGIYATSLIYPLFSGVVAAVALMAVADVVTSR